MDATVGIGFFDAWRAARRSGLLENSDISVLLRRFPMIARVLLSEYRDTLGKANITMSTHRLDRHDWEPQDAIRLREMMPATAPWLLRSDNDNE
jgi:hypothetical protein